MTSKLLLLAAGGVGYVLGARAGRERYEQLRQSFEKFRNDPRVQEKAQQAADTVREQAPQVAGAVKEKAGAAAGAAKDKVGSSGPDESVGDDLNPDRLKLTDDTGPKGTLP